MDVLIAWFALNHYNCLECDITNRNDILAPPKKMTKDEIEKELGYKIDIIGAEQNSDSDMMATS